MKNQLEKQIRKRLKTAQINIMVTPEEREQIQLLADEYFDGNISQLFRAAVKSYPKSIKEFWGK